MISFARVRNHTSIPKVSSYLASRRAVSTLTDTCWDSMRGSAESSFNLSIMREREYSEDQGIARSTIGWSGAPMDTETREYMESRFHHDFSDVRVHTDSKAAESAKMINAHAYTIKNHLVFGDGLYAPRTSQGKNLLEHELTHVMEQRNSSEPIVQRFTADMDADKVYLHPEQGDTDSDLERTTCSEVASHVIAGRKRIDVTACLPKETAKAMSLGPYNCTDFVRSARGEARGKTLDPTRLLTVELWKELVKKGFRVRSFGVVKKSGKVEAAEGLSWKQISPQMGDIVFMKGKIKLTSGKEPNPAADNFTVTWDHVGIFIVRSRTGLDYHLAKDGDENPLGVYHTGQKLREGETPGAYIQGTEGLIAYLALVKPKAKP